MKKLSFFIAAILLLYLSSSAGKPEETAQLSGAEDLVATNHKDYLAADEIAEKYRTGKIDPAVLNVPEEIEKEVLSTPKTGLRQLALYLKEGAENDYQIVKRIHDWIDNTIAYGFYSGTSIWEFVAEGQTTNCTGYTYLFKQLAAYAGIESYAVIGYSRTYRFATGRQGDHAWNVVVIDGKSYIVDTTSDKRMRSRDGVIGKKQPYTDNALFIKPEIKIMFNLLYNERFQLLDKPVSFEEYMKPQHRRLGFYKYGLEFGGTEFTDRIKTMEVPLGTSGLTGIVDGIETDGEAGWFILHNPEGAEFNISLRDEEKNDCLFHAFTNAVGERVLFYYKSPKEGIYRVNISARFSNEDPWESVYTFVLEQKPSALF